MRSTTVAVLAFSLGMLLLAAPTAQAQSGEDPTPAPRWLEIRYDVEITENLSELTLNGTVDLHEFKSNSQTRRACGNSCTADELRDLYDSMGPNRRQELVQGIEDTVAQRTEGVLSTIAQGGEANAQADLDESSIQQAPEGDEFQPPIPIAVTGNAAIGALEGTDYSDQQIDALFRMGARAPVPVHADVDPGTNLTLTLSIPAPLAALETGDGPSQEVSWSSANWKAEAGSQPKSLDDEVTVGRPDVVVPQAEEMDIDVVLDLSEVDVHYLGALTGGQPASLDAVISVNASIEAVETPTEMPEGIRLPFISADAIRIGIANGIVDQGQILSFEDEARRSIRSSFQQMTGEPQPVSGGFIPATLEPSEIGEPPGTGGPVILDLQAEGEMALPPENGGSDATAFEITRVPIGDFELPEMPTPGDRPARITMILPDGMSLDYERFDGNVTRSTTDDGRTAITFTSGESGASTTIQGAEVVVNHPVIWNLFWPLLLFLLIVLVGIPGLFILAFLRRRRERTKLDQAGREPSPISGGYESPSDEGDEGTDAGSGSGGPES